MKEILELIATYGLPIVLTCWFVFRIDNVLTTLSSTMASTIEWLKAKEVERRGREEVSADAMAELKDQNTALLNEIKILEVKIGK